MEQPKWHEYMIYVMRFLQDGNVRSRAEIVDAVAKLAKLTPEQMSDAYASGDYRYVDRIGWALTYLKQSGLIVSPAKTAFRISEEGKKLMESNPKSLTRKDLKKYPAYQEFVRRSRKKDEDDETIVDAATPEETIDFAVKQLKSSVCAELLEKVRQVRPDTFEMLMIELIKKMGYGDENDPMSGIRTGGSGDGGIDGVIKEDKLGLDLIYIQAKRYKDTNPVDPHAVRDFIGALVLKGAKKGIFITSSSFSNQSREHARQAKEYKVVLVDGEQLSELMYEYGVGVSQKKVISIKKLDGDAFEE